MSESLPSRHRIRELDGVRGVAILLVMVWHYGHGLLQTTSASIPAYLIWLGSIFYGVYLYHEIVSGLCYHFLTSH